jgi:hypothetical protein
MKKLLFSVTILMSLSFANAQGISKPKPASNKKSVEANVKKKSKSNDVSFVLAKNYFVNNTISTIDNPKIESEEEFNKIFGMATHMGKDGKPTEIDFSKKNVIAVILPVTDVSTEIQPISLKKNGKKGLVLTYKTKLGEKQSFTTHPNFAIIVDKAAKGKVTLKQIK